MKHLFIIIGPVACGKSMLAAAIIGGKWNWQAMTACYLEYYLRGQSRVFTVTAETEDEVAPLIIAAKAARYHVRIVTMRRA